MKYILCILFLLNASIVVSNEGVKIAEVVSSDGEKYTLVEFLDEEGGSLFIEKQRKGLTELLGGDSTPFPLSKYGIQPIVAKKLVTQFVDYEIANTKGGVKALQSRLSQREYLPNDLLEEYSKRMTLNAKPFYLKFDNSLKEVIRVLKALLNKRDSNELGDFLVRELRPVRRANLEAIANKTSEQHLDLVLKSAIKFSSHEEIQLSIGVYAGRQASHFKKSFAKLNIEDKNIVKEAVKKAIASNIIGGKVKVMAGLTLKDLQ
ncbi:MAG: hypothetical protein KC646_16615 [Candidatus Cloacimonetes bacterium]|nr:hypothetical protein [Candidatus Cloacimonadota bacterium]